MSQTKSGIQVGHVHLKVSDLERSVTFYQEVLGMEVMVRYSTQAAFMSYDGYHHHLGLNTWQSKGGLPAPRNSPGLYHFALLYPTRAELARAVRRVLDHGAPVDGASDHGVSEAVYLSDPDGNGIELYWDRDPQDWPRDTSGRIAMTTDPLDLSDLLAAAVEK
jgi:catechol 2,3-dioxygenase